MNCKKIFKNIMNKKIISITTLVVWIIFSAGYIGFDQWTKFRAGTLQGAYTAGRAESIYELMMKLENADGPLCDAVTVFAGEQEIDIINVACLRPSEAQSVEETPSE
jgi:hypothetical protein